MMEIKSHAPDQERTAQIPARVNRYLLIQIVGSRSGGSDLLRLDLISSARPASYGSGRWALGTAAPATGARLPRRSFAGVGRSRPSGLRLGLGQALENGDGTGNSPERLTWRIEARVGASRDGAARALGDKGNEQAQKEKGREEELDAFLTSPGSCNDRWRRRIGGAGDAVAAAQGRHRPWSAR
jgi:hypothetical protein